MERVKPLDQKDLDEIEKDLVSLAQKHCVVFCFDTSWDGLTVRLPNKDEEPGVEHGLIQPIWTF